MNWTEEKIKEVYEEVMRAAVTDEEFRSALIAEPTAAIEKLTGEKLPEGFKLKVLEEDADSDMTILLPPMLDDELSDEEAKQVAGGKRSPFELSSYTKEQLRDAKYKGQVKGAGK